MQKPGDSRNHTSSTVPSQIRQQDGFSVDVEWDDPPITKVYFAEICVSYAEREKEINATKERERWKVCDIPGSSTAFILCILSVDVKSVIFTTAPSAIITHNADTCVMWVLRMVWGRVWEGMKGKLLGS
eukprot:12848338-Ditylum_brightwellii.AAC.1